MTDTQTLLKMCAFSDIAYSDGCYIKDCCNQQPESGDFKRSCIKNNVNKDSIFYFDASETGHTDAQVHIFKLNTGELVISCRGTESKSDVLTDLKAWKNNLYDIYYHKNYKNLKSKFGMPAIHAGFYDQYSSIRFIIYHKVYEYLLNEKINPTLIFVGHSLGGALATIGSVCIAVQFANRDDLKIKCYTYGSPRVGDKNFANIFNHFVKDSERIVNELDPVPMIPRMTGYKHVKGLKHMCQDNNKIGIFGFNKAYQRFNRFMFKVFKVLYYSETKDHSLSEYEKKINLC
jgi:hypothetical protein